MPINTYPPAATGGGEGGNPVLTVVEVDLGSTPVKSGSFTITDSGMTTGKDVIIRQANGPCTGKGLIDGDPMDRITAFGKVTSSTAIQCYWESTHYVSGNIKILYLIGA